MGYYTDHFAPNTMIVKSFNLRRFLCTVEFL